MDTLSADHAASPEMAGRVLVVDDDPLIRALHRAILAKKFVVATASSGEEALDACGRELPDLVLLDVEMPGLNGYETCRHLRQTSSIPIIFATGHQTMEEQLKAFDAGGDDIITKPVVPELLTRKVMLAIARKAEREQLAQEKFSMQNMAMSFLSSVGESGVLLNFMRKSLGCRTFEGLAENLVEAAQEFGLESVVVVRHAGGESLRGTHGEASALERSILEKSSTMGRIFQFKRNLVVNYDHVSVMSCRMPEDEEKCGRIRDNLAILAETTEAFCESVEMRQESMAQSETMQVAQFSAANAVEQIREKQFAMMLDVRLLLQELTDNVEKAYSWLGITNQQEKAISDTMNQSVQKILLALENSREINAQFVQVLEALRGEDHSGEVDIYFPP